MVLQTSKVRKYFSFKCEKETVYSLCLCFFQKVLCKVEKY